MAANSYVDVVAGVATVKTAQLTSAGAGDANKVVALDASGRIDASMMPVGVGGDTQVVTASEALTAGNWVNVYNNAAAFAVRKADATTPGKETNGFVLASFAPSAAATVYFEGTNTAVTGQTAGRVYLSTTAGAGTATSPTTVGQVSQLIGWATSATTVNFNSGPAYSL
jgi:hypothetical protein